MMRRHLIAILAILSSGLMAQSALPEPEPALNRILFIMDASNSMYGRWEDSGTKMEVAQRLMGRLLDSLAQVEDPHFQLALRVYGHQKPVPPQDCGDTRLEVSFGHSSIPRIKKVLRRLRPMGTTPIALSLSKAAGDFASAPCPSGNCRDIVVLITDGKEECGGDPCEASRILQKQGITLKPFVIGVGLDQSLIDAFDCVGTFFDARDEGTFKRALGVIVNQILDETSAQVNLMDVHGHPSESNMPVVLRNVVTGKVSEAFVHTLNYQNNPDTIQLDPLITYEGVVYTIPPVTIDSVMINPGKHNHIGTEAHQGNLTLKVPGLKSMQNPPLAVIRNQGETSILNVQPFNSSVRYIAGTYDIDILTLPRYQEEVTIKAGQTQSLTFPAPGNVTVQMKSSGYGSIFLIEGGLWTWVTHLQDHLTRQQLSLQPGNYKLVYRPKSAMQTSYSITKTFTVTSGSSTLVRI
ncbi:MAG: VWA domain-containing protein [Schleiferiaceae bacterium]|nr:VWA domain-containing protein [Schleiferiaceae bacterium]MDO7648098.1 VWA domain-containing protein [Schleiferiaceae bacterium]MDO7651874.1 VWA domain-containing protein [Schleiferiaceae bacterium]MDO7687704.1 VWA domain-containing protein [Schleiferiaceae bacterium]